MTWKLARLVQRASYLALQSTNNEQNIVREVHCAIATFEPCTFSPSHSIPITTSCYPRQRTIPNGPSAVACRSAKLSSNRKSRIVDDAMLRPWIMFVFVVRAIQSDASRPLFQVRRRSAESPSMPPRSLLFSAHMELSRCLAGWSTEQFSY